MTLEFEVYIQNKPGDVARVAEALGRNSVNIRGISTDLGPNKPMIRLVTDDESSARNALKGANLDFSEREVIIVGLPDRPGELAKVAKALAKSGINIESLYILGARSSVEQIALVADHMERAREVLGRYLV